MTTLVKPSPRAAMVALCLFVPLAAHAQDQRFRASFAPAVATVSDNAELALGGTFGYRVSKNLWFEGDLTWIDAAAGGFGNRDFEFGGFATSLGGLTNILRRDGATIGRSTLPNFRNLSPSSFLSIGSGAIPQLRASIDGSTLIGTLGVRWEFPVETDRFRPYVSGGIGLNNTEQHFALSSSAITAAIDESSSHTGYALNGGVGASFRITGQLWAEMDAKYFRLSRDRDVMRLGGGVGFRF